MAPRFNPHTTDLGWNRLPPIPRLLAWAVALALITALIQGGLWALSLSDPTALNDSRRTVLLLTALITAIFLASRARRSSGDYGLAVTGHWPIRLILGLGAGAVATAGWFALAIGAGAVELAPHITARTLAQRSDEILLTLLVAPIYAFLIAGFITGELRTRHGQTLTAVAAALLATALFAATTPILPHAGLTLTTALIALLLVQLRLLTGDLILSIAALTGAMLVERLARKADALTPSGAPTAAAWLAPGGDPRAAPALWAGLILLSLALALWLRVRPAPAAPTAAKAGMSRSFKLVYPLGTMGALAPLDVWIPQLFQARFRIGLIYLPRLIATLALSTLNTVLTLPERLALPLILRNTPVQSPVFVLGVHRSGTTHLQNLLALDPQFITPNAMAVMNPFGFRFSGYLLWPILMMGTPWKRPMDSVAFSLDAPNEEEYALANACGLSPDWSVRLPGQWDAYDRFANPASFTRRQRARWQRVYLGFLRRLVMGNGKRPMLKNPYNTGRVALLREMFPDARFIHIHRHPFDTYRSNLHMADQAHCLFQLQHAKTPEQFGDWFLNAYRAAEDRYIHDTDPLPNHQHIDIAFEDLEADALAQIQKIYHALNLPYTDAFDTRLRHYLGSLTGYKKNIHRTMPHAQQQRIYQTMAPHMHRWHYPPPEVFPRATEHDG